MFLCDRSRQKLGLSWPIFLVLSFTDCVAAQRDGNSPPPSDLRSSTGLPSFPSVICDSCWDIAPLPQPHIFQSQGLPTKSTHSPFPYLCSVFSDCMSAAIQVAQISGCQCRYATALSLPPGFALFATPTSTRRADDSLTVYLMCHEEDLCQRLLMCSHIINPTLAAIP